jgi:hypothetical protein
MRFAFLCSFVCWVVPSVALAQKWLLPEGAAAVYICRLCGTARTSAESSSRPIWIPMLAPSPCRRRMPGTG